MGEFGYGDDNDYKRGRNKVSSPWVEETMEDVLKLPMIAVPDYGITQEGAEYFEVKSAVSQEDGRTVVATYYPSYSQKGKLCGYKKVDWTLPKKKRYSAIGTVGVDNKLFGQQQAEKVGRNKKALIYLEGEGDVICGWQAIKESVRGTKYEDLLPHIVGLNCGTKNAAACTTANEPFIRQFEKFDDGKIVLGFDNDQATKAEYEKGIEKGWDAIEKVAGILMSDKLFVYDYGNKNDPREIYQDGNIIGLGKLLTFRMKKYHPEKIVNVEDLTFEELTKPREEGLRVAAFPELNDKIHGFRKKELVLMFAPSGAGKSTVVTEFADSFTRVHNQKVGLIYLEEVIQETTLRFIAKYLGVNYNSTFKFNPLKVVTEEQFKEGMAALKGKIVLVDHFGSMCVDVLIRKVKYMEHVDGVDFIILDHISMIFSGTKTTDERKLIDILMTELSSYVSGSEIGMIAISHMSRNHPEFKKDKEGNNLPTWITVRKEDLRGSGSLEQLSWIIIGIEYEMLPDRSRGRIRLVVLKNRPWSAMGECDVVRTDDNGKFFSCPDDCDEPYYNEEREQETIEEEQEEDLLF